MIVAAGRSQAHLSSSTDVLTSIYLISHLLVFAHLRPLQKTPKMLSLPTEIRLAILEYLLICPEPLHNVVLGPKNCLIPSSNHNGAAKIVTTCRQLAYEALPIIYERNSFEILIFTPLNCIDPCMVMLDEELSVESRPAVLSRVRKLRVNLRGSLCEMDEDETWADRRTMHQLCELLRANVDLTQLELEVDLNYRRPITADNPIREFEVLQPLAFLRGVKLVTVTGVDKVHACALQTLMMTPGRTENAWRMKTAFQDWCDLWTGDPDNELDGDATAALYACDIAAFKRHRRNVILQLKAEHHSSVSEVFKYD